MMAAVMGRAVMLMVLDVFMPGWRGVNRWGESNHHQGEQKER